MDQTGNLMLSVIGAIITLIILWYIIASASRSKAILMELKMQSEVIKDIAVKYGIEPHRINEIVKKYS